MNKQRIIIIISGIALAVLILLFTLVSYYLNQTQNNPPPQEKLTQDQSPEELNNPDVQISLHIEHISEHFEKDLPETAPVTNAELTLLEEGVPDSYEYVEAYSKDTLGVKYSPNRLYTAEKTDQALIARKVQDPSFLVEFAYEDGVSQSSFVWLRDNIILLVEKNTADNIDKIYLLNTADETKTFVLGSFPAQTRFNLEIEPARYNNAEKIVFTDNDNQQWEMEVEYKNVTE